METKHKSDCKMAYGRKDKTCPRCIELLLGAKPRAGWSDSKRIEDARRLEDMRNHDCQKCNCGVICTAFDW